MVGLSTFRLDGLFFVLGALFGVFLFGESISSLEAFQNSSYMGRLTLPELFGLSTGTVVLLVVLMALAMFVGAEVSEKYFGRKTTWKDIKLIPTNRVLVGLAPVLIIFSVVIAAIGQPTVEDKWAWIEKEEAVKLKSRDVYIHPGELLEVINDALLYTTILDVRSETDYNLFHLEYAKRIALDDIRLPEFIKNLQKAPANTVFVLVSNSEHASTAAYKMLRAQGLINLYILEGGINEWLATFPLDQGVAKVVTADQDLDVEKLNFAFNKAVGSSMTASNPGNVYGLRVTKPAFQKKVKIQRKKAIAGGCG